MLSYPGFALLLIGLFLYVWTWVYIPAYNNFPATFCQVDLENTSTYIILIHAYIILVSATIVVGMLFLMMVIKLGAILSYSLCPRKYYEFSKYTSRKKYCCFVDKEQVKRERSE